MLDFKPSLSSTKRKNSFSLLSNKKKSNSTDSFNSELEKELSKPNALITSSLSLQHTIKELNEEGERLSSDPSLRNFHNYKAYIKKIFNSYINKIYKIDKIFTLDKTNFSKKEFHIIKIIDNELSSLLKLIRSENLDNIKIMNKVLSIKGIIINYLS